MSHSRTKSHRRAASFAPKGSYQRGWVQDARQFHVPKSVQYALKVTKKPSSGMMEARVRGLGHKAVYSGFDTQQLALTYAEQQRLTRGRYKSDSYTSRHVRQSWHRSPVLQRLFAHEKQPQSPNPEAKASSKQSSRSTSPQKARGEGGRVVTDPSESRASDRYEHQEDVDPLFFAMHPRYRRIAPPISGERAAGPPPSPGDQRPLPPKPVMPDKPTPDITLQGTSPIVRLTAIWGPPSGPPERFAIPYIRQQQEMKRNASLHQRLAPGGHPRNRIRATQRTFTPASSHLFMDQSEHESESEGSTATSPHSPAKQQGGSSEPSLPARPQTAAGARSRPRGSPNRPQSAAMFRTPPSAQPKSPWIARPAQSAGACRPRSRHAGRPESAMRVSSARRRGMRPRPMSALPIRGQNTDETVLYANLVSNREVDRWRLDYFKRNRIGGSLMSPKELHAWYQGSRDKRTLEPASAGPEGTQDSPQNSPERPQSAYESFQRMKDYLVEIRGTAGSYTQFSQCISPLVKAAERKRVNALAMKCIKQWRNRGRWRSRRRYLDGELPSMADSERLQILDRLLKRICGRWRQRRNARLAEERKQTKTKKRQERATRDSAPDAPESAPEDHGEASEEKAPKPSPHENSLRSQQKWLQRFNRLPKTEQYQSPLRNMTPKQRAQRAMMLKAEQARREYEREIAQQNAYWHKRAEFDASKARKQQQDLHQSALFRARLERRQRLRREAARRKAVRESMDLQQKFEAETKLREWVMQHAGGGGSLSLVDKMPLASKEEFTSRQEKHYLKLLAPGRGEKLREAMKMRVADPASESQMFKALRDLIQQHANQDFVLFLREQWDRVHRDRELLRRTVNIKDPSGLNLLFVCVVATNPDALRALLNTGCMLIDSTDVRGFTALVCACEQNDRVAVETLLRWGADITVRSTRKSLLVSTDWQPAEEDQEEQDAAHETALRQVTPAVPTRRLNMDENALKAKIINFMRPSSSAENQDTADAKEGDGNGSVVVTQVAGSDVLEFNCWEAQQLPSARAELSEMCVQWRHLYKEEVCLPVPSRFVNGRHLVVIPRDEDGYLQSDGSTDYRTKIVLKVSSLFVMPLLGYVHTSLLEKQREPAKSDHSDSLKAPFDRPDLEDAIEDTNVKRLSGFSHVTDIVVDGMPSNWTFTIRKIMNETPESTAEREAGGKSVIHSSEAARLALEEELKRERGSEIHERIQKQREDDFQWTESEEMEAVQESEYELSEGGESDLSVVSDIEEYSGIRRWVKKNDQPVHVEIKDQKKRKRRKAKKKKVESLICDWEVVIEIGPMTNSELSVSREWAESLRLRENINLQERQRAERRAIRESHHAESSTAVEMEGIREIQKQTRSLQHKFIYGKDIPDEPEPESKITTPATPRNRVITLDEDSDVIDPETTDSEPFSSFEDAEKWLERGCRLRQRNKRTETFAMNELRNALEVEGVVPISVCVSTAHSSSIVFVPIYVYDSYKGAKKCQEYKNVISEARLDIVRSYESPAADCLRRYDRRQRRVRRAKRRAIRHKERKRKQLLARFSKAGRQALELKKRDQEAQEKAGRIVVKAPGSAVSGGLDKLLARRRKPK